MLSPCRYTTCIAQCGANQQLRRAMELVAEMRSRGIGANVHTYSALMNGKAPQPPEDTAHVSSLQRVDEGQSSWVASAAFSLAAMGQWQHL